MGSQNVLPRLRPDRERSSQTMQSGVSARDPARRSVTGGARSVSLIDGEGGHMTIKKAGANRTGSLARSAEGGAGVLHRDQHERR